MKDNIFNILGREDTETALVLTADRMCRIAQNPLTRDTANELRRLAKKVTDLVEAA